MTPTLRIIVVLGLSVVAVGLYFGTRDVSAPNVSAKPSSVHDRWTGKVAPEFALQSLDNRTVHLSDFRGKVTLVNFWATWCGPCRVEMPALVALREKYRNPGFEVLGVAMDDNDRAKVENFAYDMRVSYPIVLKDASVGAAYGGVRFLPQSFLLDRQGKVLAHIVGMLNKDEYEAEIVRALHRPTGA
jgi:thiol-disulfide isomerase/thioredoxin